MGGRQDSTWTASSSWPGHSYGWGRGDGALVQPLTQEVEGCWAVASGKGRMARGEETPRVWGEGTEWRRFGQSEGGDPLETEAKLPRHGFIWGGIPLHLPHL